MISQDLTIQRPEASATRKHAPVFVLGCVRSGTTLLYHMLLSAGGVAVYRAESNAINLLEPRFGDLSIRRNKEKLMEAWLNSKLFRVSGLHAESIRAKVIAECKNGGDFLRIVMGEVARSQNVGRWADCTPEHLLYLPRIKETIPNALIVHIIRDGRDVALSTAKLGYVQRKWKKTRQAAQPRQSFSMSAATAACWVCSSTSFVRWASTTSAGARETNASLFNLARSGLICRSRSASDFRILAHSACLSIRPSSGRMISASARTATADSAGMRCDDGLYPLHRRWPPRRAASLLTL